MSAGLRPVALPSLVDEMDEAEVGAPVRKPTRRYRTMGDEIQALMKVASEGAAGDPVAIQAPVGTTASDPNAGSDTGEQPAAPPEVTDESEVEIRLGYLEERLGDLDQSYLTSQQARVDYFHLLMRIAESRWQHGTELWPVLDRIEKMLQHMRFFEDGWPNA